MINMVEIDYKKVSGWYEKHSEKSVPNFNEYLDISPIGQSKVIAKESKSITSDIDSASTSKTFEVKMPEEYETVMDYVLADSEIRAFYSILRDTVIRSGYKFNAKNKSKLKSYEEDLKRLKFRKLNKRIVWDTLIYKHAFIEIQSGKGTGKVKGLKMLDPSKIRPIKDIHDNILFWIQYVEGLDLEQISKAFSAGGIDAVRKKGVISWEIKEIAHITIDEASYKFFGITDVETLKDIIEIKDMAVAHLKRLFKQGWFRVHFHGKNIGDKDITNFLDMIATSMKDPDSPLTTVGAEDMEGKKYVYEQEVIPAILSLLSEMRNKILTLIRVPPIIAGTVDNSNRSNSDVQAHFALLNRVRAIQEDIEDDLPSELFDKMGMNGLELIFNENTNRDLREIVDISAIMINLGADPKKTIEWAESKGYYLPSEIFPSQEELDAKNEKAKLVENSNLNPSRKPQDNSNKDGFKTNQGTKTINGKDQ